MQATQTRPATHLGGRVDIAVDVAGAELRLITGMVMAYYGWNKVDQGISGFGQFLDSLSVPFPGFMAYVVTFLELGGGILLIVGLLSRLWALLFAVEMVFTTILVKLDVGFISDQGAGMELDMLIFAAGVALLFIGPGRLSLDHALGIEPLSRWIRRR